MNRLIETIKKIRVVQIFTAFMAGVLLLVSTACNSPDVLAKTADRVREEVPSEARTSEFKGGMNDYKDTDPRDKGNVSAAEAKAQMLKDSAERRITTKASNNVPENIRRVGDEGQDKLDEIGQKLDENKDAFGRKAKEFADNTKQGMENIKDNTRRGIEGAKDFANEATNGATDKVDEGANTLKSKVSQGVENVKRAADRATN
ncbi:hypothetical protein PN499_15530 [Kamptonema animale CS-326]|jgi:ElaB/YqjD/DUF883 family membrane-anchored ribosome-binding protein|uniref:DUF6658 family protein n=1 Tax=Kamptonema animale TaxID=92934 RepID=UPI00232E4DD0|nr:DUF6658 family protein [Kamptonema animale]MDB9512598.1 hypothetical protein [Kamptonema animale CS-326]